MNLVKYLSFSLLMIALCFATSPLVLALDVTETDSEEYLLNHGHSAEIIRMVEMQENRNSVDRNEVEVNNKFVKFWKNLWHEKDLTMPLRDFGRNSIDTVESPNK